ncbi:MAG: hypothetical protein WAZ12_02360 [Candidatus Absconditicoccaceae bacterium]
MDTNAIFLFTGEEKYLLDLELNRWKEGFIAKFGINSFFVYNNQNFSSDELSQTIYSGGLFTSKKMIVVKGLPLDTHEGNKITAESSQSFVDYFKKHGSKIPDDTILIFVSYKPDGRSAFLKSLNEVIPATNKKQFDKLKGIQLKTFIRQQLGKIQIHELDIEYLLIKIGDDLYRIVYECEKLITRCQIKNIPTIDHEIIDHICFGMVESNTFAFFDNLFTDQSKTLSLLDKIRDDGVNRNQFAGTLYRGLRVYLFILDLYDQGITDSKQIISITKLHPFVVSKNLKNITQLQKNQLQIKKFYTKLIELDASIKSGKFPDTYFRLGIKKIILN